MDLTFGAERKKIRIPKTVINTPVEKSFWARTIPKKKKKKKKNQTTPPPPPPHPAMTKAFEKVSTGLVTFAARDTEFDGKQIKKGEIIGLDNSKLAYVDKDINKVVLRLVKKLINSDTSYVTLIYGADVTDENAEKMQKLLSQKLNDRIEVMLINGGQPVYYYIISVE